MKLDGFFFYCLETNFNPTIEAINVVIKNNLQNVAGSLKTKIPTKTVPTAPIPVQTAYAVPIGIVSDDLYSNSILILKQNKKPTNQSIDSVPELSFAFPKQLAKPTSKKPPKINKSQFIFKA